MAVTRGFAVRCVLLVFPLITTVAISGCERVPLRAGWRHTWRSPDAIETTLAVRQNGTWTLTRARGLSEPIRGTWRWSTADRGYRVRADGATQELLVRMDGSTAHLTAGHRRADVDLDASSVSSQALELLLTTRP